MALNARHVLAAFVAGLLLGALWPQGPNERDHLVSPAQSVSPRKGRYERPHLLGHLEDRSISESSGLAASAQNPNILWTHNDSGDGPFIYCIDLRARSCGVWQVDGATAYDWEDADIGPGPQPGLAYLYIGDIGDNQELRERIVVHRVPEPVVTDVARPPTRSAPAVTDPVEVITLRYPDGAHDAEALLVHPGSGDIYVITKETIRSPTVFVVRAPFGPGANALERIGRLPIPGGLATAVTAGAISPDGTRVAVATYLEALEFVVPPGRGFDSVWRTRPHRFRVGRRVQGESITYRADSNAVFTTSESVPAPLFETVRAGSRPSDPGA